MRLAAYAALLAVAHGTALAGDREFGAHGPARGLGGSPQGGATGGTTGTGLYRGWTLQADGSWRYTGNSGGNSRVGGCGCQGPGGMHAGPI
jgi:hypothetical protein